MFLFDNTSGVGSNLGGRYPNPYFGVAHKYIPINSDSQLWWANFILVKFGFWRTILSRISNYFITSISIECDDTEAKEKYKEYFDSLHWKNVLSVAGLNYLAYGNTFLSITQGFDRFLLCPKCKRITSIDKILEYDFSSKAEFTTKCSKCSYHGKHEVIDKPSREVDKLNIIFWNPREIIVRIEETTNDAEYFWRIPEAYKQKVIKANNKFYSKKTPKMIYDAINNDRLVAFNSNNFIHLKAPTPCGLKTDGRSVPFCIYLFEDFFQLKILQRFNEALCLEDIVPFRVFAMGNENNSQANPILTQSAPNWKAAVQGMIQERRRDPGSYHIFPFPLNYQQLGSEGKQLVPVEMMAQAITNILNAMNCPQELYTLSLQAQAVGPALRLFENSWSLMIDVYNEVLTKIADVIRDVKGIPKAKVKLIPVTVSDDMERKSIIGQLVSANAIARSELLGLYNFDFKEQLKKKQEEEKIQKELQEEAAIKEQLRDHAEGSMSDQQTSSPSDILTQAQEIAQQLFPLSGAERREKLQQIKAVDANLYGNVKMMLEELTSQAKSQGNQQAQVQAQNNPQM